MGDGKTPLQLVLEARAERDRYRAALERIVAKGKASPGDTKDDIAREALAQPSPPGGEREMKYRKKPVVIEAVQWTGNNLDELRAFVPEQFRHNKVNQPLGIVTLEGVMTVSEGDYIIKGVNGEFYPCKPEIFALTHEPA